MTTNLPLSDEKKLTVIYRVEPGCLGPDGENLIGEFCSFAQAQIKQLDTDFIHWHLVPRNDKALPEMQYKINNKTLSHNKAVKYLAAFDRQLDDFEDHLNEKLADLIELHLANISTQPD